MKTIVLLAGLLAAQGVAAQSADEAARDIPTDAAAQAPAQRFLAANDRDEDGKLSPEEIRNYLSRTFDERDADGDGSLSPEEHGQAGEPAMNRDTFMGQVDAGFATYDTNGDGFLDLAELGAARQARAAAAAQE